MNNITKRNPYGLYDPFFDDFFTSERNNNYIMKTDIKELDDHYELKIDVPEIKKENIHMSIDEGYLVVEASQHENNDEKKNGKYIRRERHYGTYKRSFYVGDDISQEDCKASLNDGVLTINIAKKTPKKPEKKYITIE